MLANERGAVEADGGRKAAAIVGVFQQIVHKRNERWSAMSTVPPLQQTGACTKNVAQFIEKQGKN